MACGVQVVTANVSAVPAVVGDAGILIIFVDTSALARALSSLASIP
jgi:glycosyltransferase involved in cell wall biosynthesis